MPSAGHFLVGCMAASLRAVGWSFSRRVHGGVVACRRLVIFSSSKKFSIIKFEQDIHSPLEEGLEPSTLWLTATRSNQLSYSSLCYILMSHFFKQEKRTTQNATPANTPTMMATVLPTPSSEKSERWKTEKTKEYKQ